VKEWKIIEKGYPQGARDQAKRKEKGREEK
jgi:hypothetical protein